MQDATATAAKMAYLKAIADGIRDAYGCYSLHIESGVVSTLIQGKRLNIQVETFKLVNCQAGTKCFAWLHPPQEDESGLTFATVIATAELTAPDTAVRSFVTAQAHLQKAD